MSGYVTMTRAQKREVKRWCNELFADKETGLCRVAKHMGVNYQALRKWGDSGKFPAARVVQFLSVLAAIKGEAHVPGADFMRPDVFRPIIPIRL